MSPKLTAGGRSGLVWLLQILALFLIVTVVLVCRGDSEGNWNLVAIRTGSWSNWEPWLPCSVTCGSSGTIRRYRFCRSPKFGAGSDCGTAGVKETQEETCPDIEKCKVSGSWSRWSENPACSKPCGTGHQRISRSCDSPHSNDQDVIVVCPGDKIKENSCFEQFCPITSVLLGQNLSTLPSETETWSDQDVYEQHGRMTGLRVGTGNYVYKLQFRYGGVWAPVRGRDEMGHEQRLLSGPKDYFVAVKGGFRMAGFFGSINLTFSTHGSSQDFGPYAQQVAVDHIEPFEAKQEDPVTKEACALHYFSGTYHDNHVPSLTAHFRCD